MLYSVFHCKSDVDDKLIVRQDENAEEVFQGRIKDEAKFYAHGA